VALEVGGEAYVQGAVMVASSRRLSDWVYQPVQLAPLDPMSIVNGSFACKMSTNRPTLGQRFDME